MKRTASAKALGWEWPRKACLCITKADGELWRGSEMKSEDPGALQTRAKEMKSQQESFEQRSDEI